MVYKPGLRFNAFLILSLVFLSVFSSLAGADEVFMDFNDGVYPKDEWNVTDHDISARFVPYERGPITYTLKKGKHTKIKGVSMEMQLRTTTGAARANVYIECTETIDGFEMNTYPEQQLWQKSRHWEMSAHCLDILNATGKVILRINVYWDGHGTLHLLNLKMVTK